MPNELSKPSEAELGILQVLWIHEPATVRVVHEELCKQKVVGYTTTLKQMQRMLNKQMIERTESGNTHLYKAVLKEEQVQKTLFKRFLNTAFKGSAMKLVMHALGQADTSMEELEALEKMLKEKKKERK